MGAVRALLLLLVMAACSRTPPTPAPSPTATAPQAAVVQSAPGPPLHSPPTRREIVRTILALRDQALPTDEATGCTFSGSEPPIVTVGDYLAFLLGTLADNPEDSPSLTATCTRTPDARWDCTLLAALDHGEPWGYGIRATLWPTGAVDVESLRCPGSP